MLSTLKQYIALTKITIRFMSKSINTSPIDLKPKYNVVKINKVLANIFKVVIILEKTNFSYAVIIAEKTAPGREITKLIANIINNFLEILISSIVKDLLNI